MRIRKTIFGRQKMKYSLYFKTTSSASNFNIKFAKLGISRDLTIYVKMIGLDSNNMYYEGLHVDSQNFDLSSNSTNEEIGYYLSVENFGTSYINFASKNLTYIDFSRIRTYWSSINNLSNNNITNTVWGGVHNLSITSGYDFSNNSNFTFSQLPSGVLVKNLSINGTNILDIYPVLSNYLDLTYLNFGTIGTNNFASDITHPKLIYLTLSNFTNTVSSLSLKDSPFLKYVSFTYRNIISVNINNCVVFENIQAWDNSSLQDINRIGSSKLRLINIGVNSFTSAIKDKIIQYCLDDGILNGVLQINKTVNPPTNSAGLATLQSRGWTGTSF